MTSMTTSAWARRTATWPSMGEAFGAASRPVLHHRRARLLDADLPELQHLLVRPLVETVEVAVAEDFAPLRRGCGLILSRIEGRLRRIGHRDASKARPGEVLHPGCVGGGRIDRLDRRLKLRRRPPVVHPHARVRMLTEPFG